jgi:hypothetical protein
MHDGTIVGINVHDDDALMLDFAMPIEPVRSRLVFRGLSRPRMVAAGLLIPNVVVGADVYEAGDMLRSMPPSESVRFELSGGNVPERCWIFAFDVAVGDTFYVRGIGAVEECVDFELL